MSFAPLRRYASAFFLISVLALQFGCDSAEEENLAPAPPVAEESERSDQRKIIAFGDSLTAGFGIGLDEAYPAVLQEMIDREGYPYEVINAGVSGETSAGGVRRLSWVLDQPDVEAIILALGGNDGLRGLPPREMKKNLATMVEEAKSRDITVLLAGFQAPPDARDRYVRDFVAVFPEVAQEHDVTLMPSLLQGVIGVPSLNQPDGKHPNAKGARVVAENVWSYLKPLLKTAP
ncbi:MAG TPA: arylesterase [Vicinamibacteria bacterium]|nr:arylesterase [Vicinamibacteria bacterium]